MPVVDVAEVTYQEAEEQAEAEEDVLMEEDDDAPETVEEDADVAEEALPEAQDIDDEEELEEVLDDDEEGEGQEAPSNLPGAYNLAVPFTPQAPHANWDLPYQEACEEASALMVAWYFEGRPAELVDPDEADEALLWLVEFQLDMFGDYLDTTAEQTRQMLDGYFNLQARVVDDPTVEQIKEEIAAGRPVILPAAGRQLGNPYFSGEGPLYHMLVIKGYTENQFIVNDPGTKRGQNYAYDIDVIMNAMGDWNDGDPANGEKRVIFVSP